MVPELYSVYLDVANPIGTRWQQRSASDHKIVFLERVLQWRVLAGQRLDLTLTALHRGVGLAYMGRLEKRATVPQKASVSVSLGRPASVPASTPHRERGGLVAPLLSRAADRTRTAPFSLYGSTGRTDPGTERSQDARGPVPWPMAAQSDQCVRRWFAAIEPC